MADMHDWVTAISKVVSTETTEEVIIRGHKLSELIKSSTFAEAVFLMISGRMPTPGQARTLDALFVACVDHGITPAAMIGRAFASYGTSPTAAIAGGILMFGEIAGGAGAPLARDMTAALQPFAKAGTSVSDDQLNTIAKEMIAEALKNGGRMNGFGIPAHATDPRSPALIEVARKNGAIGIYTRLLLAIETKLRERKGKGIPINLDGIVASLILDFGFPWQAAAAFVMIPRSFSTLAHHLEEKEQNTRWRHVPQEYVTYTGPMPE